MRPLRAAALALVAFACAGGAPMAHDSEPLAPCPRARNCVSSRASDAAHRVEPFALRAPAAEAWAAARRALAALPRTRVVEERPGYLRAESRSRLFGFVDDVELALAGGGRRIDVRSAARLGWSDLGVNRRRVEALRAALRADGVVE